MKAYLNKILLLCLVNLSTAVEQRIDQEDPVDQIAVKILQSCYQDYNEIVMDTQAGLSVMASLEVPQIIYNSSLEIHVASEHRRIVHLFLVVSDSVDELQNKLTTLKYSPWWSVMADFIILSRQGCANAKDLLRAAWKFNLVTSFVLCHAQEVLAFTFNPYTSRAPEAWEIKSVEPATDNRWTLYYQEYHSGICSSWNFDRTKFLDGYKVKIVISKPQSDKWIPQRTYDPKLANWKPDFEYGDSVLEMIPKLDSRVIKAVKQALNASVGINFESLRYYAPEPEGFFKRLLNESSDLAVCISSYSILYNFTPMYPIIWSGVSIVTQHRGFYTPVEKIMNFYGLPFLLATLIILLVTFVAEVMSADKYKVYFATFEVLRLVINAALHIRMETFPRRIFFTGVFLYFLILHATFSSNLSSFLSKIERRRNVESMKDLKSSIYSCVYVIKSGRRFITDPELEKKIFLPKHPFCVPEVLKNASVACVADSGVLTKAAVEYDVHLARKEIAPNAFVYPVRFDWPLADRVNLMFIRLAQSGVSLMWGIDMFEGANIKLDTIAAKSVAQVRPISLDMLKFAYILWGFGLIVSTLCFMVEMFIGRKK